MNLYRVLCLDFKGWPFYLAVAADTELDARAQINGYQIISAELIG
jgi:hypothetical protein